MKPLQDKVAIVTGAGRPKGIGRSTALRLAEQGAAVVVTDLCRKYEGDLAFYGVGDDRAQLDRVVGEIEARGGRGLACAVDVTRRDEIAACVEQTVAAEFGEFGIRCNAICPGMVDTDMGDDEYRFISMMDDITVEEARRRAAQKIALRRQCTPDEVADVVAYLCSPAAGYLTAVALPITGGMAVGL